MPTYFYVCPNCGHSEEIYHSMTIDMTVVCDECLVEKVRKPQSGNVIFKGSGWGGKGGPF